MKQKHFSLSDWASICVIVTLLITIVTLWPTIWGFNKFMVRVSDLPDAFDSLSRRMDAQEQRQDRTDKNVAALGRHFGVPMVSDDAPVGKVPLPQPKPQQWATVQERRIEGRVFEQEESD